MLTAGSITWVHYDAAAAANPNQLRVRRVNASYDQRDLLYTSGAVVPDYLGLSTEGYGVPNVIVELEDSSLIGVLGCSVGYGGSGGSLTHIALTSLQVPALRPRRKVRLESRNQASWTLGWTTSQTGLPLGSPRCLTGMEQPARVQSTPLRLERKQRLPHG